MVDEKHTIASRIGELDSGDLEIRKPTLPSFTAKSAITDVVGDRSRLLFDLLGVLTGFFLSPDRQLTPEYDTVETDLKNLSPLNDSSDLAPAIRLNTNITRERRHSRTWCKWWKRIERSTSVTVQLGQET